LTRGKKPVLGKGNTEGDYQFTRNFPRNARGKRVEAGPLEKGARPGGTNSEKNRPEGEKIGSQPKSRKTGTNQPNLKGGSGKAPMSIRSRLKGRDALDARDPRRGELPFSEIRLAFTASLALLQKGVTLKVSQKRKTKHKKPANRAFARPDTLTKRGKKKRSQKKGQRAKA